MNLTASLFKSFCFATACFFSAAGSANAQTCSAVAANLQLIPLAREGECPLGYFQESNYCVPNEGLGQALAAIQKVDGRCPLAFFPSGDYCLSPRNYSNFVILKTGETCPRYWNEQQKGYCVKQCPTVNRERVNKILKALPQ